MIAFRAADLNDRRPRVGDRDFIRSTWSRCYKQSFDAGMIWHEDWAEIMHKQIDRVLDRDGARAVIAYEKDAPGFLYGWIAGDTSEPGFPVVFFCYVKEPYRRHGYGAALLQSFGIVAERPFTYTCRTSVVRRISDKIPFARYNPLEVRYPKEARRSTWPPNRQ